MIPACNKYPVIEQLHYLKEEFREFFNLETKQETIAFIVYFKDLVAEYDIPKLKTFCKTMDNWLTYILDYYSIWVRKGKPGELELVFPYNEDYIAKVRGIRGRKWDVENKKWLLPDCKESMEQLLKLFTAGEVIIDKNISDAYVDKSNETGSNNAKFLDMMTDGLKLKGCSKKTIKSYISHVGLFFKYCKKDADLVIEEDINKYLLFLLEERQTSHSYVNQAVNSIKFLFKYVLMKDDLNLDVARPKRENKLPEVLSQKEVLYILGNVSNLKHKAIPYLIYSAGLSI